jgi:hypothetical protein
LPTALAGLAAATAPPVGHAPVSPQGRHIQRRSGSGGTGRRGEDPIFSKLGLRDRAQAVVLTYERVGW